MTSSRNCGTTKPLGVRSRYSRRTVQRHRRKLRPDDAKNHVRRREIRFVTSWLLFRLQMQPLQGRRGQDRRLFSEERLRNSFVAPYLGQQRNTTMDREHVKGAADKAKGAIKEGAGKLSGDKDMETEGKIDKAKGSAHNAAGDVKDAARDAADAIKK